MPIILEKMLELPIFYLYRWNRTPLIRYTMYRIESVERMKIMDSRTLKLFETLTELHGAPGHEHEVRDFMKQELSKYADEIIHDNLGGVFGIKHGSGPKVMVAGHMDEVGFLVTQITKQGLLRF